jgi:hypothetical protein
MRRALNDVFGFERKQNDLFNDFDEWKIIYSEYH